MLCTARRWPLSTHTTCRELAAGLLIQLQQLSRRNALAGGRGRGGRQDGQAQLCSQEGTGEREGARRGEGPHWTVDSGLPGLARHPSLLPVSQSAQSAWGLAHGTTG